MINRQSFYSCIKTKELFPSLAQSQVDGINAILNEWEKRGLTDLRWLAYMFATAYHETAKTMRAIEEYGKGKNYPYGKKVRQSGLPYGTPDKIYYGRGLVQLTWYENYANMGKLLNVDLLNKPELALDINIAVQIMFEGMIKGSFTSRSLSKYFSSTVEDWVNARRIINGTDKAESIAEYGKKFYTCLNS